MIINVNCFIPIGKLKIYFNNGPALCVYINLYLFVGNILFIYYRVKNKLPIIMCHNS